METISDVLRAWFIQLDMIVTGKTIEDAEKTAEQIQFGDEMYARAERYYINDKDFFVFNPRTKRIYLHSYRKEYRARWLKTAMITEQIQKHLSAVLDQSNTEIQLRNDLIKAEDELNKVIERIHEHYGPLIAASYEKHWEIGKKQKILDEIHRIPSVDIQLRYIYLYFSDAEIEEIRDNRRDERN